jgi:hypothetical protein
MTSSHGDGRDGGGLEDMRAGDLTPEQLCHLAACMRAVRNADPLPPLAYEKRELTTEEHLCCAAEEFRAWGAPEDLIGVDLARKLLAQGYSQEEAAELLRAAGVSVPASFMRTNWSEGDAA